MAAFTRPPGTIKVTFGKGGDVYPVIPINNPGWTLSFDLSPRKEDFVFTKEDAKRILGLAAGSNGDFVFTMENHLRLKEPLKVKRLRVLGKGRKVSAYYTTLRVVDRMYDIQQTWKKRTYNERLVGDTKLILQEGKPAQITPIANDVIYRKSTLNPTTNSPWTAAEVVEDVLEDVAGTKGVDWELQTNNLPDPPIESFFIDDKGNVALAKAAGMLTGTEGFCDLDGKIIIGNRLPGAADSVIKNLDPPLEGSTDLEWIDRSLERPAGIKEGFDLECEVRFDAIELPGSRGDNDRFANNVITTVDTNTQLVKNGELLEFPAGTNLTLGDILQTVQFESPRPATIPKLNLAALRRFWLSSKLENRYVRLRGAVPEPDLAWARRIGVMRRDYRQQFQINRRWADASRDIKAERLLVISKETGQRAAAEVFTTVTVKPSQKGLRNARDKGQDFGWVIDGSITKNQSLADSSGAAPAVVTMKSKVTGTFRVDYNLDLVGLSAQIVPSGVVLLPNSSPLSNLINWDNAQLSVQHKLAIVLTLMPMVQSYDDLNVIDITPQAAQAVLPGIRIGSCKGPILRRRVREGLLTSRYGWDPAREEALKRTFGLIQTGERLKAADNNEECTALATADAAVVYSGLADHWLGTKVIPLRPDLKPLGEISSVRHSVNATGKATTVVNCEYGPPPIDGPLALLPQSFQRSIFKLTNPSGS